MQARPTGYNKFLFLDKAFRLVKNIENGEITHEEVLQIKDIIDKDLKAIVHRKKLNESQIEVGNILFLVDKTFTGKTSLVEETDERDPEV